MTTGDAAKKALEADIQKELERMSFYVNNLDVHTAMRKLESILSKYGVTILPT